MNDDRSLERAARSWLEEGPTRAPDRTVDAALTRIHTTRQERDLVPWRLPTMNPVMRLAGAAIVVVLAVSVVFLATRPASNVGPPATISPTPSSAGSVAPTSGAPSVAPTIDLPTAQALAPTAVIDLAGMVRDTIPLTTDGTDVWVGVDGAVIHIDGQTNATKRIDVPDMSTGNGEMVMASDGLWIEDYAGGRFLRINPLTGAVEVTGTAPLPRTIFFVDDQLWIGTKGGAPGAHLVDRATGALGPRIGTTNDFAVGLGDLWMGGPSQAAITRYDASTGASTGTIDVPPGTGCYVGGAFPDNVWAACPADFGTCPANSTAVRIDPVTNGVVTTARICSLPVVIDGTPWFLAGRMDGTDIANSLVSVDPATGRLLAQFDLGKIDYDRIVLTDKALWLSDEQGDRIVRYDLTSLRP
jgi:hypothetical protein